MCTILFLWGYVLSSSVFLNGILCNDAPWAYTRYSPYESSTKHLIYCSNLNIKILLSNKKILAYFERNPFPSKPGLHLQMKSLTFKSKIQSALESHISGLPDSHLSFLFNNSISFKHITKI